MAGGLAPERVEAHLVEPPLQERPGVDPRGGVTLVVDLVARPAGLAAEEVVEPHLVQRRGGGVGGEVASEPRGAVVGAGHHGHGVPAHDAADALLHLLVAGKGRLLLGRDGVDVGRLDDVDPQVLHAGALEHPAQQEPCPLGPSRLEHPVQGVDPLLRLLGIGVEKLLLEQHALHGNSPRGGVDQR